MPESWRLKDNQMTECNCTMLYPCVISAELYRFDWSGP